MIGVGIPFKRPPLGIVKNGLVAMYMPYKQYAEGKTGQTLYNEKKDYLPVTNMVANGDFSQGTSGWTLGGGVTVSDKKLVFNVGAVPSIKSFTQVDIIVGHKYYFAFELIENTEGVLFLGSDGFTSTYVPIVNNTNTLGRNSLIVEAAYKHNLYLTTQQYIGFIGKLTNIALIDLTATFGAGNEPTLEQCDVIFPDWFDGTQNMLLPLTNGRLGSSSDPDTNDPTFKGQGLTFDGDDFVAIPGVTLSKGVTFVSIFTPDNISGTRVHLGSNQHTYDGISSSKIRASESYNNVQCIVASSMTLEDDKPYFMTSRRSYGLFDITVNGIKDSYPTPDDIAYNPGNYSIRSLGCYTPGSACFSGNLSFAAIYDRILTDAEIERNYRVLKREMAKVGVNI